MTRTRAMYDDCAIDATSVQLASRIQSGLRFTMTTFANHLPTCSKDFLLRADEQRLAISNRSSAIDDDIF